MGSEQVLHVDGGTEYAQAHDGRGPTWPGSGLNQPSGFISPTLLKGCSIGASATERLVPRRRTEPAVITGRSYGPGEDRSIPSRRSRGRRHGIRDLRPPTPSTAPRQAGSAAASSAGYLSRGHGRTRMLSTATSATVRPTPSIRIGQLVPPLAPAALSRDEHPHGALRRVLTRWTSGIAGDQPRQANVACPYSYVQGSLPFVRVRRRRPGRRKVRQRGDARVEHGHVHTLAGVALGPELRGSGLLGEDGGRRPSRSGSGALDLHRHVQGDDDARCGGQRRGLGRVSWAVVAPTDDRSALAEVPTPATALVTEDSVPADSVPELEEMMYLALAPPAAPAWAESARPPTGFRSPPRWRGLRPTARRDHRVKIRLCPAAWPLRAPPPGPPGKVTPVEFPINALRTVTWAIRPFFGRN